MLTGCKEQSPLTNVTPVDTTQTAQQKNVLIEDITGVQCVNCPQAHDIMKQIALAHPGRVELVSIHAGQYAVPYPYSQYNFAIPEGTTIANFLGSAGFWPIGAVDRKIYSGQSDVLLDRGLWTGLATQELSDTMKMTVGLTKTYNAATRQLNVTVALHYLVDVLQPQKITVYITESGIVDAQVQSTGAIDTFYVHNNVLRATLSNPLGDAVTQTTTAGTDYTQSYSMTLPTGWNAQNCRVVGFVGLDSGTAKDVLQVSGIAVQ